VGSGDGYVFDWCLQGVSFRRVCSSSVAYLCYPPPKDVVRDWDLAYGEVFSQRVRAMGIRDRRTSPRSPWQNGYVERLIGSIRRECVDHIVLLGEQHLRHGLLSYMSYYNETRTHPSTAQRCAGTARCSKGSPA
jgi:transposase InsO family protein